MHQQLPIPSDFESAPFISIPICSHICVSGVSKYQSGIGYHCYLPLIHGSDPNLHGFFPPLSGLPFAAACKNAMTSI